MPRAGRYGLVIFDWDGTVADSTPVIVSSMQQAIADLGWPARSDDAIRSLIGLDFRDSLVRLYPEADVDALLCELMAYRQKMRHPQQIMETPLYDGAREAMEALRAAGYRLAVATGKTRPALDRALSHHDLAQGFFAATRTADEAAAKPHPRMLFDLLASLCTPSEQALMVGDTDFDLHMARAAQIDAVAVSGGAHREERLRKAGPLGVLDGVHALPQWLGMMNAE